MLRIEILVNYVLPRKERSNLSHCGCGEGYFFIFFALSQGLAFRETKQ